MFNRNKRKLEAIRDELNHQLEVYDFQIENCERASQLEQEERKDIEVIANLETQKFMYEKARERVMTVLKMCY